MKRFNTHLRNGISLIEVVIALSMIATLLTPILVLQTTVFKRVVFNAGRFTHFMPIKSVYSSVVLEPLEQEQTTREFTQEEPSMQLAYKKEPIKEGKLARFKGLHRQEASGTWQEWDGQKELSLSLALFEPEEPEEDAQKQEQKKLVSGGR